MATLNKQNIIKIAHSAQKDAGGITNFNAKVTMYMEVKTSDPVAAFLGALISGSIEDIEHDFDFYFSELNRVREALKFELND